MENTLWAAFEDELQKIAAGYYDSPAPSVPAPAGPPSMGSFGPNRAEMGRRVTKAFTPAPAPPTRAQKFSSHMAALRRVGNTSSSFQPAAPKVPAAFAQAPGGGAKQRFGNYMGALKGMSSMKSNFKVPKASSPAFTPAAPVLGKPEKIGLEKQAKVRVGDIEDRLGAFLGGKDEDKVRHLIAQQKSKRLGMRHPILTGIPTLGIWPAVSKEKAKKSITNRMLRDNTKYRSTYNAKVERQRADAAANRQAQIDSDRANAARNTVMAAGIPLSMYLKHKETQRREDRNDR